MDSRKACAQARKMFDEPESFLYIERLSAGVAQQVEQLICNQPVGGSIPSASSSAQGYAQYRADGDSGRRHRRGEIPKRPKGADCKSVGSCLRRFESSSPHQPRARAQAR